MQDEVRDISKGKHAILNVRAKARTRDNPTAVKERHRKGNQYICREPVTAGRMSSKPWPFPTLGVYLDLGERSKALELP